MNMNDYVIKIIVKSYKKKWFNVFKIFIIYRNFILRYCDPVIKFRLNNKYLLMNLSHQLPIYLVQHKLYDTAIPRIINIIKSNEKLFIVDVGANIGDTSALIINANPNVSILCVEGNPLFLNLLKLNYKDDNRVTVEESFCSDILEDNKISLETKRGTATINSDTKNTTNFSFLTLDDIIQKHIEFSKIDFIKIDTDGFDYKVLRGSNSTIAQNKPLIFFELDKSFLIKNNEEIMSIFNYFEHHEYQAFLVYDNYGFLIGLFTFEQIDLVENIINYVDDKRMYLDILMVKDFNLAKKIYKTEVVSIKSILNSN
jgi:FkbM family methyltransferase